MRQFRSLWIILLGVLVSCSGGSGNGKDGGSQTDTDSGSGTGTETETILDSGSDGESDSDTDSDLDAGASCAGFPDMTHCTLVTVPDRKYDVCVDEKCVSPGCGDAGCNVPGAHYRLPSDVGYDAFERTTDDEPVVTDKITKLVWQGCPAGMSGSSCETGAPVTMTWVDAVNYCDGLDHHGFKDWRLPDPGEFQTIVDYSKVDPAVDVTAFLGFNGPFLYWWTISGYAGDSSLVWRFEFSTGTSMVGNKNGHWGATCVRGKAKPTKHFMKAMPVEGEPVVTDGFTGLMWQGCPIALYGEQCDKGTISATDNWMDARDIYCQSQDWSGYTDWRLPNIKELMSTTDVRKIDPAIDTSILWVDDGDEAWSSTASKASGQSIAWYVDYYNGSISELNWYYRTIRCVRGP
jgi:hypothetical protein